MWMWRNEKYKFKSGITMYLAREIARHWFHHISHKIFHRAERTMRVGCREVNGRMYHVYDETSTGELLENVRSKMS